MQWSELERMSIEEVWKIFRHRIPEPKNCLISQLLGPKPIDCLPEEIIKIIVEFLSLQNCISFGMTCQTYYQYCFDATRQYCLDTYDLSPLIHASNQSREKILSHLNDDQISQGITIMMKQTNTFGYRLDLLLYIYHNNDEVLKQFFFQYRDFSPRKLFAQ